MLAKARITQDHTGDFAQLPWMNTAFARNPAVFPHTRYMKLDYRGEAGVILINHGGEAFTTRHGDRIAQPVVAAVLQAGIVEATELSDTTRGADGFGSTGMSDAALRQAAGDKA